MLGARICRDVPAVGLLALEVLGRREFPTRRAALAWLQNLDLIHTYRELATLERVRRSTER